MQTQLNIWGNTLLGLIMVYLLEFVAKQYYQAMVQR